MTLFISQENQELLYEMIHKTPEIHSVFVNLEEKNQWFRSIIESHYVVLPPSITRESLKHINRNVLGYMVSSLRKLSEQHAIVPIQEPRHLLKREQVLEVKERDMFEVPKPKPIDFSEKIEDDVITNMDELIEEQRRMRQLELQEYAPPPPLPVVAVTAQNVSEDVTKEKRVRFAAGDDDNIKELSKKIDAMDQKIADMYEMLQKIVAPIAIVENMRG